MSVILRILREREVLKGFITDRLNLKYICTWHAVDRRKRPKITRTEGTKGKPEEKANDNMNMNMI